MLGDILGFLDDITGNVVSDTILEMELKDIAKKQYLQNNTPMNLLAKRKLDLLEDIERYNQTLKEYKDCAPLVELNTKWKNEAIEKLKLLN